MSVSANIAAQRTDHAVPHAVSCRALGVAPSTFYKWHNRPPTPAQRRRAELDVEVRACFDASGGTYGSPRVRAALRRSGREVSKKTVESSMARQGLQGRAPKRRKGLTRPDRRAEPVPDLLRRDFTADGVDEKWVGDLQTGEHRRGAGVPRHRGGSVLQADAGLRAVRPPPHRAAGHRRAQHGRRGARRHRRRGDLPHRQGLSIYLRRVRGGLSTARDHPVDGTRRLRAGQRRRRVVLLDPRARADNHAATGAPATRPDETSPSGSTPGTTENGSTPPTT